MTRYEIRWFRVIFTLLAISVGILAVTWIIMQANKTTERYVYASDNYDEIASDNTPLQVANEGGRLYRQDGTATHHELETGDVFLKSDDDRRIVSDVTSNTPQDNVEQRHMYPLKAYGIDGEAMDELYILSQVKHFVSNNPDIRGNGYFEKDYFTRQSFQSLTSYIHDRLQANGCEFKDTCTVGNFSYQNGSFNTELLQDVDMYDGAGEAIGELEAGTTIHSTFEIPFASGASNTSLMRITGFTDDDGNTSGTFFIDIHDSNNERTFATRIY